MALLLKGETIEKPHRCHCTCGDCAAMARRDELKFARSRLNSYRAMASEAYISLSSEDPILTSFDLRKELCQVSREEKYYTVSDTSILDKLALCKFCPWPKLPMTLSRWWLISRCRRLKEIAQLQDNIMITARGQTQHLPYSYVYHIYNPTLTCSTDLHPMRYYLT